MTNQMNVLDDLGCDDETTINLDYAEVMGICIDLLEAYDSDDDDRVERLMDELYEFVYGAGE